MHRILITTVAVLLVELLSAQPIPQWSSSISSNYDWYFDVKPILKLDNAGDLILVGNIDNSANGSGVDILLVKYSPSGDILWQQLYNGIDNLDDVATDFEVDSQNNILITGQSQTSAVNFDLVAIKYFSNGNFGWLNSFNGTPGREDKGMAIDIDQMGTCFITGFSSIDTLEHRQIIATKIDADGNTLWTQFYGTDTTARYQGAKIKLINNEARIIASSFSLSSFENKFIVLKFDTDGALQFSNEDYMNRPASCFYLDNIGNSYLGFGGWERFKVFKVNPTGGIDWTESVPTNLPANTTGDQVIAIIVDSLQNVYITGQHYGAGVGSSSYSNADILTVKYSSGGTQLWSNRYDNLIDDPADIGNAIALDDNLNVYVAGKSQGSFAGSAYDYLVVKYGFDGNQIGTIRYNDIANGDDAITSIVVADSSNIYVTGSTSDVQYTNITTQKYSSVSGVGVSEIAASSMLLNAFPNPFSNTTSISFNNKNADIFNLQVFDVSGKLIFETVTHESKIEISSDSLPSGLYSFDLIGSSKTFKGKLIRTD